jgi:predicted esterase
MHSPRRRRRPVIAVVVLAVAGGLAGPAVASRHPAVPPPPVARSQFVQTVPLGHLVTHRTPHVAPPPRPINGDLAAWDAGVKSPDMEGTTVVQSGELVYEGYLLGDTGAASPCELKYYDELQPAADAVQNTTGFSRYRALQSALGAELIGDVDAVGAFDRRPLSCDKGVENFGQASYPAGATPGAADITQIRVAATPTRVSFLVQLDAMTATVQPVVAIAMDSDRDARPGSGAWGFGSGVATPGADHVLTLTRDAAYLDGKPATGAAVASSAATPNGFGGILEVSLPRADVGSASSWRLWSGAGIWDPTKHQWVAPQAADPGPRVLDLGFRSGAEPFTPYMNMAQAFALRRGWNGATSTLGTNFTTTVDLDALAAGENEEWQLGSGYYIRDLMTSVRDGQHNGSPSSNPQEESVSARQPYGLYVPSTYDPTQPTPMTLWLHWRGPGGENGAYYDPNMVWQLGEQRGDIIVAPRGRGESGWYVGDSQVDVFDAMADAEHLLDVDRDRVYVAGYSMGGWGTYLLASTHPDLFAGGFSIVGPPSIGLWPYPGKPEDSQNGRPLYWTNPLVGNFRHMPFVVFEGTDDELVPFTGPLAQSDTMLANKQPYRFYLYDGYEHFTFAVSDEFSLGAQFLGDARRVSDPAEVTYTRAPCLDPAMWNPAYGLVADHAYWVHDITLRTNPPHATCVNPDAQLDAVNRSGTVDVTSHAIPAYADAGHPVASTGPAPDETGAFQMTGYDPSPGAPLPLFNGLSVKLTNVKSLLVDGAAARLSDTEPLTVTVHTDGAVDIAVSGLAGLVGQPMTVNGVAAQTFTGTVHTPGGTTTFVIR